MLDFEALRCRVAAYVCWRESRTASLSPSEFQIAQMAHISLRALRLFPFAFFPRRAAVSSIETRIPHVHSARRCIFTRDRSSSESGSARRCCSYLELVGRESRLSVGLALAESALETELSWNALDSVSGVDVLHQSDLVASSATLARDDRRVGEEVLPDLRKLVQHSHSRL